MMRTVSIYNCLLITVMATWCCKQPQRKLEEKEQVLDLHYVSWACACANWATENDLERYSDTGKLSEHCVFVEPSDSILRIPDTVGYSGDVVRFNGRFYIDKGIPQEFTNIEGPVDKAKIFRYTSFKILHSNYGTFKH